MSKKEMIKALITQAKNHKKTALDLYASKHYDWCLFLWHLAIEKLLKGTLLSQNKEIIYTHNLAKLYMLTKSPKNKELIDQFDEITLYNLEARYDNYKMAFYKKATKTYTAKWQIICGRIFNQLVKTI